MVFIRKAGQSAVLWSIGDVSSQTVGQYFSDDNTNNNNSENRKSFTEWYNPYRTLKNAAFAVTVFTPLAFTWYHKIIPKYIPGNTIVDLGKKVVADQLFFGPILISSFFFVMPMFEFKHPKESVERWKNNFLSTMQRNWMVWGPITCLNFAFVPLQYRILVNNCVSIPWSGYLAWRNTTA